MRLLAILLAGGAVCAGALPPGVEVRGGAVNAVKLADGVFVYGAGADAARAVLLTSARRDVSWAAREAAGRGAKVYAPEGERGWLESPTQFWEQFESQRFHDYAQQTTKIPVTPLPVARFVKGGETLAVEGVQLEVLDTPGYTHGAVTYLARVGGRLVACTGDLIYGDGQLLDLYSLQDAIAETKTRGYHGYAARAGALLESLRRVAERKPDVLIPARGPVIERPQEAIDRLTTRLKAILQSHFSTDALRWYWGYESVRQRARSAGLTEGVREVMPFGEEATLPEWVLAIGNSRVLLSRSGGAFLVDGGYRPIEGELKKLREAGRFQKLEGIWVTHYHDDHTDYVQQVSNAFDAPVYAIASITDILENPGRYRMPASSANSIRRQTGKRDGESMRWREFEMQFYEFPGQTLYHGGLRVVPPEGPALFFAGDSFTPAGMDDYCLLNRNLTGRGRGYHYCLDLLEKKLGGNDWILNQHVDPMFRYSSKQFAYMRVALDTRARLIGELTPLPGADFGVDESWARFYPYHTETTAGQPVELELRMENHAAAARTFRLRWNVPVGWKVLDAPKEVSAAGGAQAVARARFQAGAAGLAVVTADVAFDGWELREWTEAMVRVR